MDPFLGEIRMVGCNYAPQNWALCNGQLLSIAQSSALFALLGTNFGGDGVVTFGLPDLRGRVPVHQGQGNGLSNRVMGETDGEENVTLTLGQIPAHTHEVFPTGSNTDPSTADPTAAAPANTGNAAYNSPDNSPVKMAGASVGLAGGGQPHDNMPPFQVVNFIIALTGIFPPHP